MYVKLLGRVWGLCRTNEGGVGCIQVEAYGRGQV